MVIRGNQETRKIAFLERAEKYYPLADGSILLLEKNGELYIRKADGERARFVEMKVDEVFLNSRRNKVLVRYAGDEGRYLIKSVDRKKMIFKIEEK